MNETTVDGLEQMTSSPEDLEVKPHAQDFVAQLPEFIAKAVAMGVPDVTQGSAYSKHLEKTTDTPLFVQDGQDLAPCIAGSLIGTLTTSPIQQMRPDKLRTPWDEDTAMSFALDCAERVIGEYIAEFPNDKTIPTLLKTARRYLRGELEATALVPAMKAVQAYVPSMPDVWSIGGEAAGAVWGAVTGKIGEAAMSASEAMGHSGSGARQAVASTEDDEARPEEFLNEGVTPWMQAQAQALSMMDSPYYSKVADERQWQGARLLEYLQGRRRSGYTPEDGDA